MFNASEFAKHAKYTSKHAVRYLNICQPHFKWNKFEDILEIGCADGTIARQILFPFVQHCLNRLHAVDYNGEVIEIAKENNDNTKITFSVMDIEDCQAAMENKDRYDHIFTFYLFHIVSQKL